MWLLEFLFIIKKTRHQTYEIEKAPTKKEELCPNFFYGDPQF